MKKILALLILALATKLAAAQTNQHYTITFTPSPSIFLGSTNVPMSPDGYVFFMSTNVNLPIAQWTFVGTVPATFTSPSSSNYVATTSVGVNALINPPVFAAMQYTNASGASPFCFGGLQGPPQAPVIKSISSP